MSTNMGNLEKLGILVIVILVVVVGVVAITPKDVNDRLMQDGQTPATAEAPEVLEPPPAVGGDPKAPQDPWPSDAAAQTKLPAPGETIAADPAARPGAGAPAPAADAAPEFRTVKVRANDTLAIIAKRELGAATRYTEILKANPGLVATKLKKDQEIKIPVATAAKAPADERAAGPAMPPAGPAPALSGSDRVYVVKSGDTLSGIAGHEMGSKNRWADLQKANEDVLHGSTALKVGMKLHIPGGEAAAAPAPSSTASDPAPTSAQPAPSGAGAREYVVKSGDSLWLIAKNELGSEKLVGDLRTANADVLGGSDALKVGMKLKLPSPK